MTHELVEILRENLEVAARMHHHLERSHQQIADDASLQPGQVSQLNDNQQPPSAILPDHGCSPNRCGFW